MLDHNAEGPPERPIETRWSIDHKVPLALILSLVLQTFAGIWFMANLSAKVDSALDALREFRQERYTKEDARRDRELLTQIVQTLQSRDLDHDRRIEAIERTTQTPKGGR